MRTMLMMVAMAVLLTISGGGPAVAADDDLSAKISAAKTAADHEALADDFSARAAEAEAKAAAHDRMAKAYQGGGKIGQYHADQHCAALAKRYREEAKGLKALADAERAAAKSAK